jgi:NADH-quinone oxidoreductase subunit L
VNGIGTVSLLLARWLWHVIDVRGIDRMVGGSATLSVRLAHWLWRVIDVRGAEETVERLGRLADGAGHMLEDIEPRTLQHHLVVVVCWLGIAVGLLYWLVL